MIRFEGVTKKFGPKTVLDGVDFEITDGSVTFVIGKSGTGKSVLLKHIVGLMKPERGTVRVDELDVTASDERRLAEVRRRCGMVFQFPALLDSLTVRENLAFGIRALGIAKSTADEKNRITRALEAVRLPSDLLGKLPQELSFGVQKRVAIARSVALEPRHLLFDEPTTGLDPVATNAIFALIGDLARRLKVTALVVSHDMIAAMAHGDRILMLDAGNFVADGDAGALRKASHPTAKAFVAEADRRTAKREERP